MIIEEADTPTYKAILSSFNVLVFGKDYIPAQINTICGGDGESEDEMEQYRYTLKQISEPPLPNPTDTDTDIPLQSSSSVIALEQHPTNISTPAELGAEEGCLVTPEPKKQPAPMKKVASPMDPSNLNPDNPSPPC